MERWLSHQPVIPNRCSGEESALRTFRGPGDTGPQILLTAKLATFRRKNALSDLGRLTLHATDIVFRGDFARVHSRARGEWTVPA